MVGSVRPLAEAAIAPKNAIEFYTEAHYSGASFIISPQTRGRVPLKPHQKDKSSSLRVPPGVTVMLIDYAGEQPISRTYKAGDYPTIDEGMNDRADVVVITAD